MSKYWMTADEGLYMADEAHNAGDLELTEEEWIARLVPPKDLTSTVTELCRTLDDVVSSQVLLSGFSYQGVRIQADPVAQQNATAFLTAVAAGVQIPFPVQWRTKANDTFLITDLDALKAFANKMLLFVQTVFHARWQLKDALRAASTVEQAEALYAGGLEQMRQIGDAV